MQWTYVTAVGALVIECLTIASALYLVWSLSKQGWNKVRVRLLIGMVSSDLMLGIVTLIPNILYQAGHPLKTGSGGCDATAFLVTSILFTQHMWTLVIAISTYLLLRHPLSHWTTWLEKHAIAVPIAIWSISIAHAGVWWAKVGFASQGYVCYYKSLPLRNVDGKDLVQFIPRAIVFIVVLCLYSRLYSFLRRPDTIQLSSEFDLQDDQQISQLQVCQAKAKRAAKRIFPVGTRSALSNRGVDPDLPPWEKLEIANYDFVEPEMPAPTWGSRDRTTPRSLSKSTESSGSMYTDRKGSAISQDYVRQTLSVTVQMPEGGEQGDKDEESSQTLKEFFQEHQASDAEASRLPTVAAGKPEMSAATYLNRQASLLMLWFPLAYLFVFSASLIRLVYDMVHDKPSQILLLISLWFVLSVGLIDFVVFGIAEFFVRRRVRRRVPALAP